MVVFFFDRGLQFFCSFVGLRGQRIAEDFRESEQTDHRGDEVDAGKEFIEAEGEARHAVNFAQADGREHQADHQRQSAFEAGAGRDDGGTAQAEHIEPEVFVGGKLKRDFRQLRGREDQHQCPEQAAEHAEYQ